MMENVMDTWLRENRQQYQMFVGLVQLLLNREFSPLTTEPASANTFRTDHTEAVIRLLNSFSADSISWPLRIFSTGPLFRPASIWTDAIDVEWIGSVGDAEEREALGLVADMVLWLRNHGIMSEDLTMVYGNLGWIRKLGVYLGIGPDRISDLEDALRRGQLSMVGHMLEAAPAAVNRLFHPQGPQEFFNNLGQYLNVSPTAMASSPWQTRWDLSLVGKRYYSGLVFSLYHRRTGQPLVTGGHFALPDGGRFAEGIGFTLDLDACRRASSGVTVDV